MDVMFVLLHVNIPLGRMGVGWIEPPSALLMYSKETARTVQCGTFIATIMVMHTQELPTIIVDYYN